MKVFKRMAAASGVLAIAAVGLAATVQTATASGGLGCGASGGGPTPGPTHVLASHFRGLSATETLSSVSGTIETDVNVDAFQESLALAGSGAAAASVVFVDVATVDTSSGSLLSDAFGCVPSDAIRIDQPLRSATLGATTVQVFDSFTGVALGAITVSGDWTGVGAVTRQTQTGHYHSGAFTQTFNFVGFDRHAIATGTASAPGLGLSIDCAAIFAELDKVEAGGASICVGGSC